MSRPTTSRVACTVMDERGASKASSASISARTCCTSSAGRIPMISTVATRRASRAKAARITRSSTVRSATMLSGCNASRTAVLVPTKKSMERTSRPCAIAKRTEFGKSTTLANVYPPLLSGTSRAAENATAGGTSSRFGEPSLTTNVSCGRSALSRYRRTTKAPAPTV